MGKSNYQNPDQQILIEGDYIPLREAPKIPEFDSPSLTDCESCKFISMAQFCRIAKLHGIGKRKACNAFGGDRGKFSVVTERKARATYLGNQLRKYVLVSAVRSYFTEMGIFW